MSKMGQVFEQMQEELGENATEEEIDEWFTEYVRKLHPEIDDEDIK